MRLHHAIAVALVILVGFGVKLFFFTPSAEADARAVTSTSVNVLQGNPDYPITKALPGQKMHDMTFVFSHAD